MERIPVVNNKSSSLRKLDFSDLNIGEYEDTRSFFNIEQLSLVAHSSLGVQCEILRCCTILNIDVIDLIRTMTTLRILHISEWSNTPWRLSRNRDLAKKEALVEQLHAALPNTWIHSENPGAIDLIRLWIR